MVNAQHSGDRSVIVLTPNCSASWQQNRHFVYLLGGVTLLVAGLWALAGAWLVLPFAGIEVAVLVYVMLCVSRFTSQKQVIIVEKQQVVLEQGVDAPNQRWVLSRPEVHVAVVEARNPVDSLLLNLVQGEQRIAVGEFLNQQDRIQTRKALQRSGLIICSDKWWQSPQN